MDTSAALGVTGVERQMSDNWDDDDDEKDDDSGIEPPAPPSGQGKGSEKTVAPSQPPVSSRPPDETIDFNNSPQTPPVDAGQSDTVPPKTTKDQKGPASSKSVPTNSDANRPPTNNRPPSTGNPPPNNRPPSNGRGSEPDRASFDQDAAEPVPRDMDTVREELIGIGIVTEAQWEEAAWAAENEVGDRLRAILAHLQHMPSDPHKGDSDPVLTETQAARIYEAPLQYGKFLVVKRLGKGGMGVTYLARRDDGLDQKVVLKVLRLTDRTTPGETLNRRIDQMISEARKLIKASEGDSSYFPYFIDFIRDPVEPSMVMEFVQGVTLDEYAADSEGPKLGIEECFDLLIQIAEAFAIPHNLEPPLMHLDIKPTNIMVRPNGSPVVLDFGIARFNYDQGKKAEKKRPQTDFQTRYNDLLGPRVGTPPYMPKEQWDGNPEPRSDIYALGATFYFVLTGKLAFPGTTQFEFIHKHGFADRPKPTIERPEVPAELERVVLRMMAIEADDRYQTMTETVEALREAKRLWQARLARRKRNRRLAVGGSIAAVVLTAAAVTVAMNPDKVQSVLESWGLITPAPPRQRLLVEELRDLRDKKNIDEILTKTSPPSVIFQAPKQTAAQQAECLAIRWDAKLPIDAKTTSPPAEATIQKFEEVEREITDNAVLPVQDETTVREYRRKFYLAFSDLYEKDPAARSKFDERERILTAAAEAGVETATAHPRIAALYLERAAASDDPQQALIWLGRIDGKLRPSLSDDAVRKVDAELFRAHLDLGHQLASKQEPTASESVECRKHLDYALSEWSKFAEVQQKYSEQATRVARARLNGLIASRLDGSTSDDDKKIFRDNGFTSVFDLRLDALNELLTAYRLTKVGEPPKPSSDVKLDSPQFDELSKAYGSRLTDLLGDKQGQLDAAIALFREAKEKLKSPGQFVYPREAELAKRVADRSVQRLREAEGGIEGAAKNVLVDAATLRDLFPETCSPRELPDALVGVATILEIRRIEKSWSAAKGDWLKAYQLLRDAQSDTKQSFGKAPWNQFGVAWAGYLLDAACSASSSRPLLDPNISAEDLTAAREKLALFDRYPSDAKKAEREQFHQLLKLATRPKDVEARDYLTSLRKSDWTNVPLEGFRADLTKDVVNRALLKALQERSREFWVEDKDNPQNRPTYKGAIAWLRSETVREVANETSGEPAILESAVRLLLCRWVAEEIENSKSYASFEACREILYKTDAAASESKLRDYEAAATASPDQIELLKLGACVDFGLGNRDAVKRFEAAASKNPMPPQALLNVSTWLPDELVTITAADPNSRRAKIEKAITQFKAAYASASAQAYGDLIETLASIPSRGAGLDAFRISAEGQQLNLRCKEFEQIEKEFQDQFLENNADLRKDPGPIESMRAIETLVGSLLNEYGGIKVVDEAIDADKEGYKHVSDLIENQKQLYPSVVRLLEVYARIGLYVDIPWEFNKTKRSLGESYSDHVQFLYARLVQLQTGLVDSLPATDDPTAGMPSFEVSCACCGFLIMSTPLDSATSISAIDDIDRRLKFCFDNRPKVPGRRRVLKTSADLFASHLLNEVIFTNFMVSLDKRRKQLGP